MTEKDVIFEQPLDLHTYPPSSPISPISQSDIILNISSAKDSTRGHPTLQQEKQNQISEQPLDLHTYPPPISPISPDDIKISSAEDSTREQEKAEKRNSISEQTLGLHTYLPSSSILPISHSDIGISTAEDSTRERPSLHGRRGLWDVTNETQRGMLSRHLTMIGMYTPRNSRITLV